MRPIDADALKARMAIGLNDCIPEFTNENGLAMAQLVTKEFMRDIDEEPTIDPVHTAWISVKDRLPERFAPVLICRRKNGSGELIAEQGAMGFNGWWKVYGTRTKTVTHWMPLPEPPKNA